MPLLLGDWATMWAGHALIGVLVTVKRVGLLNEYPDTPSNALNCLTSISLPVTCTLLRVFCCDEYHVLCPRTALGASVKDARETVVDWGYEGWAVDGVAG